MRRVVIKELAVRDGFFPGQQELVIYTSHGGVLARFTEGMDARLCAFLLRNLADRLEHHIDQQQEVTNEHPDTAGSGEAREL